jgi:hypothetical protein
MINTRSTPTIRNGQAVERYASQLSRPCLSSVLAIGRSTDHRKGSHALRRRRSGQVSERRTARVARPRHAGRLTNWDSFGTAARTYTKALIGSPYRSGPYERRSKTIGEGGIRTPGTVTRTLVFETSSFSRSDTSPKSSHGNPPLQVPSSDEQYGDHYNQGSGDGKPEQIRSRTTRLHERVHHDRRRQRLHRDRLETGDADG